LLPSILIADLLKSRQFKGSILLSLILILIVIAVIAVFVVVISGNSSYQLSQLPTFHNTNAPVPVQFSNVTTQSTQKTTAQLQELIQIGTSSVPQLNISYNGSLYLQPSGIIGSVAKINSNMYIGEARYGNDLKFYLNITNLPVLSLGEIAYLNLTNGTFACTNFNISAVSAGNYGKVLLGIRNLTCVKSKTIGNVNFDGIARFNLSELSNNGLNLTYHTIYQSTYKGIPCTYISGTIMQKSSNRSSTGNGAFGMCLSDKYYIPLSYALYLNGSSVYLSLNFNETSLSNMTQRSYVDSIPGPVVG
jgi:hypothetical protein